MWPRLTIEALALAEGCENLNRPDMKSWSRMSVVLAISPPTLTWAPAPNITPLGLMIRIWPLADRLPLMKEVLFERTRFSVKDCALGWAKVSDWPEASERFCQVMTAFWLDCWTSVLCAVCDTTAWPAATVAPLGLAAAGCAMASAETRQLLASSVTFRRLSCFPRLNGTARTPLATNRS